jgi:putative MATE family efflux protein
MGAAIATTIGRGLAVIYQFDLLFNGKYRIQLFYENLKVNFAIILNLLKISGGGIFQNLIATSSWILLVRIIAVSGPEAIAGYTIAIRIILFLFLPAWGLSNAAATLVGQNLGAKKPQQAEQSVWITAYANLAFMGIMGAILALFPEFFVRIFISEPAVVENGIMALRIISFGFLSYAVGMVLMQGFNGSGDTATPMRISIVSFWLFEIPLAWFLAIFLNMGLTGACIAVVSAETLLAIIVFYLFRKGKWKLREV